MSSNQHALADPHRRRMLQRATSAVGGLTLAAAAYPFLASLAPSERARAQGAPVEADLTPIAAGALATVEWRGKPVWILRELPARARVVAAGLAGRVLLPLRRLQIRPRAPTNLVVPPYGFASPQRLVIGMEAPKGG